MELAQDVGDRFSTLNGIHKYLYLAYRIFFPVNATLLDEKQEEFSLAKINFTYYVWTPLAVL